MIRPFTFLCMLLAGGSGLYLYQVKHRTRMIEIEIDHTLEQTRTVRERTGVLRAEYAFLNDPARLQGLADANLSMKQITGGQFVQLSELDRRLPPVMVPQAPGGSSDEPDGAGDAVAGDPPAPAPAPQPPAPLVAARPNPPSGIEQASATATPALPVRKPPRPPQPVTPPAAQADHEPPAREPIQPAVVRRIAPPAPAIPAPVMAARHPLFAPPGFPAPAVAPRPYAATASAAGPMAITGSSLGSFHAALPPPVPVVSATPMAELSNRR